MSQGFTAYASFVRIHAEMGRPIPPAWHALSHHRRMAWEAAAQAVALSVLPVWLDPPPDEHDEADFEEDQAEILAATEALARS